MVPRQAVETLGLTRSPVQSRQDADRKVVRSKGLTTTLEFVKIVQGQVKFPFGSGVERNRSLDAQTVHLMQ